MIKKIYKVRWPRESNTSQIKLISHIPKFTSHNSEFISSNFLKLVGKKIFPSPSVKYLGVRLDRHLNWKSHISDIATKLQRANGMLSKLRYYLPLKILVNIYHSIFSSHMRYSCQIWGLHDNTNSHRILTLQKAALRLITFSAPRTPSNPIFSNFGIPKNSLTLSRS